MAKESDLGALVVIVGHTACFAGLLGFFIGKGNVQKNNLVTPFNHSVMYAIKNDPTLKSQMETMCKRDVEDFINSRTGILAPELSP